MYFTVFSHWYFQLYSILSHYGCLLHFLICFATSKCTLHLFFTIFHALRFSTTFCFIAFRIFMVFYFMLHAFSLCCHMPGSTRYFSYFPLDHISCSSYSRVIVLSWVKPNRLPLYFYLWNIQGVGTKKAPFLSCILNKLPFILYFCHLDFHPIFILFCMLSACDLMCLVEPSSSLILLWII